MRFMYTWMVLDCKFIIHSFYFFGILRLYHYYFEILQFYFLLNRFFYMFCLLLEKIYLYFKTNYPHLSSKIDDSRSINSLKSTI